MSFCFIGAFYWYMTSNHQDFSAFHLFSVSHLCLSYLFSVVVMTCPPNSNLKEKGVISGSQVEVPVPHWGEVTAAGAWCITSTVKKQKIMNTVFNARSPFNSLRFHFREWRHPQRAGLPIWANLIKTIPQRSISQMILDLIKLTRKIKRHNSYLFSWCHYPSIILTNPLKSIWC